MHTARFYIGWLEMDGRVVKIDGIQHRLDVSTWKAFYPYEEEVISVQAVPMDKTTKYYRTIKEDLGDDWSMSVLDCDCTLISDILEQVNGDCAYKGE